MTDKKANVIALTVDGVDLTFEPNRTAYNNMVNEMTMSNKLAPAVNYLGRIVTPDSKDGLNQLVEKYPGVELQIAEAVNKIYAPQVEISVKP